MKNYWKLKSIALETEVHIAELSKAANEIIARKNAAFTSEGLNVKMNYKFDDETETLTEDGEIKV
jgi:hypothetical protein